MASVEEIRCAVVGYGGAFNMGRHHGEAINRTPGLCLVAACDLDPERVAQAERDFPGIRTFTRLEDLLAQDDIDLVTCITPHNTHASLALQVLEAGKHCIVEKPMAIRAADATAMIEAATRRGKMLSVYHNRRWDGRFLALRETVHSGRIGEVFYGEVFMGGYAHPGTWWRSNKEISGGALYDWGAHYIDWILQALEVPVTSVRGVVHKRVWHDVTNEDQVDGTLHFASGAVVHVQQSSIAFARKPWMRILGTKGAIVDAGDGFELHTQVDGVPVTGKIPFPKDRRDVYYPGIAGHLLRGEPLHVTPESARRTIAVIETIGRSAAEGRELEVPYEREYFAGKAQAS